MSLQMCQLREGLAAVGALEGLISSVDPHVPFQVARGGEFLLAVWHITHERAISCVHAIVGFEVGFPEEGARAMRGQTAVQSRGVWVHVFQVVQVSAFPPVVVPVAVSPPHTQLRGVPFAGGANATSSTHP